MLTKLLLFPLLLIGCTTNPIQTKVEVIKLTPPVEFTSMTSTPTLIGTTNEALLYWIAELKGQIKSCNLDKQKIVDWANSLK